MKESRINRLPDVLIQKILSSLPTKTVISTSGLSKEWRSRWKLVPKLKFDFEDYESDHQTFSEIVFHSLLSHEAPVLESFHLKVGLDNIHPEDVEFYVRLAYTRRLRKLVLDFLDDPFADENFIFTSSLCTCNTLETLKLRNMILVDISSPASMKSLKRLHLSFVFYKNEESIHNLLSGCPILEELAVDRTDEHTIKKFTIEVPSLQRLTIWDDSDGGDFWGYKIVALSLKYLKIEELRCQNFSLNAPELVEADITGVSSVISEEFRKSMASIKRLFLDVSPMKTTYPPIGNFFYQLVYLEMYTHEAKWWDLLTQMLEHSPKLQVLKLVSLYLPHRRDHVFGREWNKPKYVPECLLSHLETFVWKRYDWEGEKQEEVATYILKNARQLKNATFSIVDPIAPEKFNELDGVVRASSSRHLVFKFVGVLQST